MSDWMFEAATTTQPTGWGDPTLTSTRAEPWVVGPSPGVDGDATWMDDGKGALNAFDLILFGAPEDEDATPVDDVEVTHPGDVEEDWWVPIDTGGGQPPGGGGFGPDDGGGGEQPPETEECPGGPAPDGPTPADLDISDIRAKAQEAIDLIKDQRSDWEWGVITYLLNGELYNTALSTMQSNIAIGFNYTNPSIIPTGAHIVAWTHSHTDARGVFDQSRLSDVDDGARQTMMDESKGRFTVDPNLMTYVHDNRANQTREFNESDRAGSSGQRVMACS